MSEIKQKAEGCFSCKNSIGADGMDCKKIVGLTDTEKAGA